MNYLIEYTCLGCGKQLEVYTDIPLCDNCKFWADNSIHLKSSDQEIEMFKLNHYYYLVNGQCVILNDIATRSDGTEVYLVTPFYEGEAMTVSGDGGYHHEITCGYEHEGLPTLVDQLFEKAPTEKLCSIYKAKMSEIEKLSLAIGVMQSKLNEMRVQSIQAEASLKISLNSLKVETDRLETLRVRHDKINEVYDKKKSEVSKFEDLILSLSSVVDNEGINVNHIAQLMKRDFMLACLQAGGVDNWEWYDESLKDYYNRYPER